jgi:SagB-type dehydrogenase family enzyme
MKIRANSIPELSVEDMYAATANSSVFKHLKASHYINYGDHVAQLVSDGPLSHRTGVEPLPPVQAADDIFLKLLQRRRSVRSFTGGALDLIQLSNILFSGNGITKESSDSRSSTYWRTCPSSGGLGAIELFPIVNRVNGVERGVYHYDSRAHGLLPVSKGDFSGWLRECSLYQGDPSNAAVVLVISCDFAALESKYGARAFRLGCLDAGHVSQSVILAATSLGIASCPIAGFVDESTRKALGRFGFSHAPLLTVAFGL